MTTEPWHEDEAWIWFSRAMTGIYSKEAMDTIEADGDFEGAVLAVAKQLILVCNPLQRDVPVEANTWAWVRVALEPHVKEEVIMRMILEHNFEDALVWLGKQLHIERCWNAATDR
jgi:hypothetical protein